MSLQPRGLLVANFTLFCEESFADCCLVFFFSVPFLFDSVVANISRCLPLFANTINILGPPEIYFGRIQADFSGAGPERPKCARNIFQAFIREFIRNSGEFGHTTSSLEHLMCAGKHATSVKILRFI